MPTDEQPAANVDARPLWSWGADIDGNVTIHIVRPIKLDLHLTRRDIERMGNAGTPQMRAAYRRVEARDADA